MTYTISLKENLFMQNSSDDDVEVVYDEEYNPQREEELKQELAAKQGSLSGYWARTTVYLILFIECFKQNAGKYWHDFYKRNGNRFFKDRHYLDIVFDELNVLEKDGVRNQWRKFITRRNS